MQPIIRSCKPGEFGEVGQLMVSVYSALEGFPQPTEQPKYYEMLANVGDFVKKRGTELLVAEAEGKILGAVVYFDDMQNYGSGGMAIHEKNASGFRLLAVDPVARGKGIGKMLVEACISKAKEKGHHQVILHTTKSMQTAWKMYEAMGFRRSTDLDFMQGTLEVFGFRINL